MFFIWNDVYRHKEYLRPPSSSKLIRHRTPLGCVHQAGDMLDADGSDGGLWLGRASDEGDRPPWMRAVSDR